jgi:hypothetical protein
MARRVRASDRKLQAVPSAALTAELHRRQRRVQSLVQKRARLLAAAAKLEAQIRELSGHAGVGNGVLAGGTRRGRPPGVIGGRKRGAKPGVKRPRNERNLVQSLSALLKGKTLNVTTAAEEVQKAGYNTTSPNFRTIVNQTLLKKKHFKKVGRGKYTAR